MASILKLTSILLIIALLDLQRIKCSENEDYDYDDFNTKPNKFVRIRFAHSNSIGKCHRYKTTISTKKTTTQTTSTTKSNFKRIYITCDEF